jgi:hypothetical protein
MLPLSTSPWVLV